MAIKKNKVEIDKATQIIKKFDLIRNSSQRLQYEKDIVDAINFVHNEQYTEEQKNAMAAMNVPPVVYNEIKPARNQSIQQITANNPKFQAVPRENSDVRLAGRLNDFMDYLWDCSYGNEQFVKGVEYFTDCGLFAMEIYYDPYADEGNGEIKFQYCHPLTIYIDPNSVQRNGQDGSDMYKAILFSESQLLNLFPDIDISSLIPFTGNVSQYQPPAGTGTQYMNRLLSQEKYYRYIKNSHKMKVNAYKISNYEFKATLVQKDYDEFVQKEALIVNKLGNQTAVMDKEEINRWVERMKFQKTNVFHHLTDGTIAAGAEDNQQFVNANNQVVQSIPGTTISITLTKNQQLIDEGILKVERVLVDRIELNIVIGEKLYSSTIIPLSLHPFAITMLNHLNSPYCYGDVKDAKEVQEQINKTRSLITVYNTNLAALKLFVPDGTPTKDLEERIGKSGTQFFKYDPQLGGIPIQLHFQQLGNGLYEQLDRDKFLIQRIYGVYEFQDGAASSMPQTKGGTLLIDEFGQRRAFFKRKFIENALDVMGKIIGQMIPHVYKAEKLIRIVDENNKIKELIFNNKVEDKIINDLTVNFYDVRIISGSTTATHRGARLDTALAFWDRHILRDDETVLRLSDLPNVDDIIKKNSMLEQLEAQVQQLTALVKQLQGDMQTKDRELQNADRIVAKKKFESDLVNIKADIKAAKEIGKQRLNDIIINEKELSKGSGKIEMES